MRLGKQLMLLIAVVPALGHDLGAGAGPMAADKAYRIVDGRVDMRTYDGFRRYHAACNHCHGPDGMGSTIASSLIDDLADPEHFRQFVLGGVVDGTAVMKGFADDPNIAPYVDDIYAYLQARADGAIGRGRPMRVER
jgi:mono/diheme cytochrome c family protein